MVSRVGGNQQPVNTKNQTPAQKAAQNNNEPLPLVQKGNTTTYIVDTNGATEVVQDGTGGLYIEKCIGCQITEIVDKHAEINGDNYGEINVTTGDQSPIIKTTGPVGVTYGDGSDVNQATGKKAKIEDKTVINNIQQAPVEEKPAVKQETIDAITKMGIPQEDIDRLVAQEEYIQSHLKENMTSLRSQAILLSAKSQNADKDEAVLAEADKARFPERLDALIAEGSKFRQLPKTTQETLLKSGLPASAIADIVEAGYDEHVKFDKENKILKLGNAENGTILKIDTSNEKFTQNFQIGRAYVIAKNSEGKNIITHKVLIDGASFDVQYGYDPVNEFGVNNGGVHNSNNVGTEFVVGERAKINGITVDRDNTRDKFTFAKTKNTNYLEGEKPRTIRSEFAFTKTENTKREITNRFFGIPTYTEGLKNNDKIVYHNNGDALYRLDINGDKKNRVSTAQNFM